MLLLDRANHLDAEARPGGLVAALRRFAGVGLVVSHDRTLLDELTVRTLRIDRGRRRLWSGGYTVGRERHGRPSSEAEVEGYQALRREQRKLDRRVADQRQRHRSQTCPVHPAAADLEPKDIDARSAMAQRKFRAGEKAAADVMADRGEAATAARRRDRTITIAKELGNRAVPRAQRDPKRMLATVGRASCAAVAEPRGLLEPGWTSAVERDTRVWLRGPNGAGKTTLLSRVLDRRRAARRTGVVAPQDLTGRRRAGLLDRVQALDPEVRGRVLAVVAALGVDPDVLLATEQPSPGEARKLAMALGLGRQAWLAVLDGPPTTSTCPRSSGWRRR